MPDDEKIADPGRGAGRSEDWPTLEGMRARKERIIEDLRALGSDDLREVLEAAEELTLRREIARRKADLRELEGRTHRLALVLADHLGVPYVDLMRRARELQRAEEEAQLRQAVEHLGPGEGVPE